MKIKNLQIHPLSDVQSTTIGAGTRIWQYCIIFPKAKIGSDCNICAHVLVENDVIIGDNVTVKSGVQLWDGLRVGNGVFIGPNVTFTNDKSPRSGNYPDQFLQILIEEGASLGANATILPGVSIGSGAMIGAGAVVTKNVPPYAIVVGNPGVIVGYVGTALSDHEKKQMPSSMGPADVINLGVGGSCLYNLPYVSDTRGGLSVAQYEKHLPFVVKRCFWVFDVPSREVRGEHAHKALDQYLICVKGSVSVVLDDGDSRTEITLDRPNLGLHIPPLVWGIQYKYSSDAVLLVLASDAYDSSDYLRNYEEFLFYIAEKKHKP
jgi:UDP-2-acetamido-3-amino-2,3-dideoxy-glucuronate N-acetyltransferase